MFHSLPYSAPYALHGAQPFHRHIEILRKKNRPTGGFGLFF